SARPLFDHFIDAQVEGRGGDLLGRRQALVTLQPLLEQIEDQTLRKLYEGAIAERLSLPPELLSSQGVSEQHGRREEREWKGSAKRWKQSASEKLQETLAAHLAPPKVDPLGGATPAQKLLGFERQGLQLLIQYPRLLGRAQALKIEEDFSDPRLSDFLRSLYNEWSQYQRISGSEFLSSCSDRALSAALQDCFAEPIHFTSPAEQESALSELALRLRGERLRAKYTRCLQALAKSPEGSHERRALAAELAEVTEALRALHTSPSQSLSPGA
ncbi:MAG: hypothetical protein VYD19_08415, partial [Myxococcota bacterium]|nr:hypothetical protein [Myxococcota bacterium]